MNNVTKQDFLDWLNTYGLSVEIYNFNGGGLSFDGSDGSKISDRGLKKRKIIAFMTIHLK